MITFSLLFTFALALIFFTRLIPRLFYPYAITSDTYFHLDIANKIRENGFVVPEINKNYIIPHRHLYPSLYHQFLALFGNKYRLSVERLSGALFDTLIALTMGLFAINYFPLYGIGNVEWIVVMACILYCVYPMIIRVSGGPRSFNGSPRVLGQLFFVLNIATFLMYNSLGSWYFFVLSSLAVGLLIVTAKFAFQVVVFFTPFVCIFISWHYILIFFAGFLLSAIFTKGKVLRIINDNIRHSYFYYFAQKNLLYPSQILLSSYFKSCFTALNDLRHFKIRAFTYWAMNQKFYIHLLVVLSPHILYVFFQPEFIFHNAVTRNLFFIVLLGVIVFFITSIRPFLFLGEAERYIEYISFPAILLFCTICIEAQKMYIYYGVLIYFFGCSIYYLPSITLFLKNLEKNYFNFFDIGQLIRSKKDCVIMPLVYFHCKELVYHCDCKVVSYYPANVDKKLFSEQEIDFMYYKQGHMLSANIVEVSIKHNVDYIFAFRKDLESFNSIVYTQGSLDFFNHFNVVYDQNEMLLLEIKK